MDLKTLFWSLVPHRHRWVVMYPHGVGSAHQECTKCPARRHIILAGTQCACPDRHFSLPIGRHFA